VQVILDRLEAISKILLILGTLVGGAWAIFEYLEKKQDGRVAESLGYVRRLSSEPLLSAQARISIAWYASVRSLESTPVSSADEFARRKRQLVMMVVDRTAIPLSSSAIQNGLFPTWTSWLTSSESYKSASMPISAIAKQQPASSNLMQGASTASTNHLLRGRALPIRSAMEANCEGLL
jgi:hypothetical protein